jgi:hypothetical protein
MGQKEVMAHAGFVVILDVLAEIAFRVLDGAELVFEVHWRDDLGRQDVGAAAELAPAELVPQLAIFATVDVAPAGHRAERHALGLPEGLIVSAITAAAISASLPAHRDFEPENVPISLKFSNLDASPILLRH